MYFHRENNRVAKDDLSDIETDLLKFTSYLVILRRFSKSENIYLGKFTSLCIYIQKTHSKFS